VASVVGFRFRRQLRIRLTASRISGNSRVRFLSSAYAVEQVVRPSLATGSCACWDLAEWGLINYSDADQGDLVPAPQGLRRGRSLVEQLVDQPTSKRQRPEVASCPPGARHEAKVGVDGLDGAHAVESSHAAVPSNFTRSSIPAALTTPQRASRAVPEESRGCPITKAPGPARFLRRYSQQP